MPTHLPIASSLSVRLAHLNGLIRKPKAPPAEAAKTSTPRQLERPPRVQSAGPAPANRFLHLNANLPPMQTQAVAAKGASEPKTTPQALAAQILAAAKPRATTAPRTEAERIAASILVTHNQLRPQR